VISGFEKALNQLPQLEKKIAEAKAELKSTKDGLLKNKQELAGQEKCLEEYQDEVKAKEAQLEKELSAKMKQLGVEKEEMEDVAALRADLAQKGLDLKTVVKIAKEF